MGYMIKPEPSIFVRSKFCIIMIILSALFGPGLIFGLVFYNNDPNGGVIVSCVLGIFAYWLAVAFFVCYGSRPIDTDHYNSTTLLGKHKMDLLKDCRDRYDNEYREYETNLHQKRLAAMYAESEA